MDEPPSQDRRDELRRSPSVLFEDRPQERPAGDPRPPFFGDLNLDAVLASMTAGFEGYRLEEFFSAPLHDVDGVRYRHEVLHDLEREPVLEVVEAFSSRMREMRDHLEQVGKRYNARQKQRWFLDAVGVYCEAVRSLAEGLSELDLSSRGLTGLREYLDAYVRSEAFGSLAAEVREVMAALADVTYSVLIKGDRVTVGRYEGERDHSVEVEETFARFRVGAVKDHRVALPSGPDIDHVEARILELVARLFPEPFAALDLFCERHLHYLDGTVAAFDREVQFYLAYLRFIRPMKDAGLPFCYPRVSARSKEEHVVDAFDLALADKLVREGSTVVCNGFELSGPERVLVVTGPNQGGKTTFARMFGQLHHLAALGLPVPGRQARLFLPDRVFAHFEREEDLSTLRGKLEDELVRIREILEAATGDSVVVLNESFASTTVNDALFLGEEVIRRIVDLGSLAVYVTFIDELASLDEATVSMVGTVSPDDPAIRTYRIVRKPAEGLAYAIAIAEKHGLTYGSLKRRVAS